MINVLHFILPQVITNFYFKQIALGNKNAVKFLLEEAQVDPNPKDRWSVTPISDARMENHDEIVALLRDNGGVASEVRRK